MFTNTARCENGRFDYIGYHGCDCHCHMRLYCPGIYGPYIVIFTELFTNNGTSVTNMIEHLAGTVFRSLPHPEYGLRIFEHYPERGHVLHRLKEEFSEVRFKSYERGQRTLIRYRETNGREISERYEIIEDFRTPEWTWVATDAVSALVGENVGYIVSGLQLLYGDDRE